MEKRYTFSILSKKLIYIAFPFLLLTCKEEELSERTYPRMDISEDIIQTETGIQFKGIILTEGNSEVIESGFIWSTSEDLDQEFSKIKAGTQNSPGSFTATASCDFVAGQTRITSYNVCYTKLLRLCFHTWIQIFPRDRR